MKLAHKHEGNWAYIPILGYEEMDNDVNIASLHYRNPAARQLFEKIIDRTTAPFKIDQAMIIQILNNIFSNINKTLFANYSKAICDFPIRPSYLYKKLFPADYHHALF